MSTQFAGELLVDSENAEDKGEALMFKRWLGVICIVLTLALYLWASPGVGARVDVGDAAAASPAPPVEAQYREVTIPAGTVLRLRLESPVASDQNRAEDAVRARLRAPVMINGVTALPTDTTVLGSVVDARRSGKVKGRAYVSMRFDRLKVGSEQYVIHTNRVGRTAPATKEKDAMKIGIPAAGGAVVGGIVGGKKGAAIGATAGGGAGTATVLSTRGQEVRLTRGAWLTARLTEPLTVRVPIRS